MEDTSNIAHKIRALLALANNNPSAAEAAAAAAKAQALMLAYNLEVSGTDEDKSRGYARFAGGLYKWQRHLWNAIAALHFCMYWNEKGNVKGAKYEHKLLGRKHNVASAQVLAEYLESAINRYAREKYGSDPRAYFSRDANAYREGIVDTLVYRLNLKRQEAKAAEEAKAKAEPKGDTANALTLTIVGLEDEEKWGNQDIIEGLEPGTTKARAMASKARHAAWLAEYHERKKAEQEADELLKIENPEAWAARQAAAEEADRKTREKWVARDLRNQKRRKGTGYRAPKPRPDGFYDGLQDGENISLSEQIDHQEVKRLK